VFNSFQAFSLLASHAHQQAAAHQHHQATAALMADPASAAQLQIAIGGLGSTHSFTPQINFQRP